jgi:DNA repair protein RadA/Sms
MSYYYLCLRCDDRFPEDSARCPTCNEYGTLVSRNDDGASPIRRTIATLAAAVPHPTVAQKIVGTAAMNTDAGAEAIAPTRAVSLADVSRTAAGAGIPTGYAEVDRVLGGGIFDAAPILFAAQAGCGKSTLSLGIAHHVAEGGPDREVVYVTGEERIQAIARRADRLGVASRRLQLVHETNLERILELAGRTLPSLLVIDSIQVIRSSAAASEAGTAHQVRLCVGKLAQFAQDTKVPIWIIGHITKDGEIAGPETLKHLVDVVLYLEEGDDGKRYLSTSKNRHGATTEIGVLAMTARGMVDAPEAVETTTLRTSCAPGSILCPVLFGERVRIVEIEALVGPGKENGKGDVNATGIDRARVQRIVAILARHTTVDVSERSVYVSVAGGLRVTDPCADLAIAMAISGSARDRAYPPTLAACGELALSGEVRHPIPRMEQRNAETIGKYAMELCSGITALETELAPKSATASTAEVTAEEENQRDFLIGALAANALYRDRALTTRLITVAESDDSVERVTEAAIKIGEHVYVMPRPARHHDVLKMLYQAGLNDEGPSHLNGQGFTTSRGRFVDREEAAQIARAASQLIREPTPANMLTSEDVW